MGAEPYWYIVAHDDDVLRALKSLRETEFEAGRYHPVVDSPLRAAGSSPGRKHDTIADALDDAGPGGTRSILDITRIASDARRTGSLRQLPDDVLIAVFGTRQPPIGAIQTFLTGPNEKTAEARARRAAFWDSIRRGTAVYFRGFQDGAPVALVFVGYSAD